MQINQFQNSQLKEFYLKAKIDIELIETNILVNKEKYDGCESSSTEQGLLNQISTYAKETYNVEVTPDIAGMEGLVDKLKAGWGKIKEWFKSKERKSKVSGHIDKTKKELQLYATEAWLNQMTFKNVGKAKFKLPEIFKEVNTPNGVKKIIESSLKQVQSEYQKQHQNSSGRLSNGLKLFNQYDKIKIPDTLSQEVFDKYETELAKHFPIKPEKLKDTSIDEVVKMFNLSNEVAGELPVLNKEGVKEAVKVMCELCVIASGLESKTADLLNAGIDYDDRDGSDFWYRMHEKHSKYEKELFSAINWGEVTSSVVDIEIGFEKQVIKLLKFLEMWIWCSIK